jgi:hypothetical protein
LVAAVAFVIIGQLDHSPNSSTVSSKNGTHLLAAHVDASVKAFDSANTISDPTWFSKAYAAGFRLYILNTVYFGSCTPWPAAQTQIQEALAAGLKVAAYTRNPDCWQNGILAAGPYQNQLQFFALDIETDPGIPATHAMVNDVKALDVRPVIYTGAADWPRIEGSQTKAFSNLPLWEFNNSKFSFDSWQANYLSPTPVAFGGWNTVINMRAGVQQQIEYPLNGVHVDLDSFDATFLR